MIIHSHSFKSPFIMSKNEIKLLTLRIYTSMLCESETVESHLKIKSEHLCLILQFKSHQENYYFDITKGKTS